MKNHPQLFRQLNGYRIAPNGILPSQGRKIISGFAYCNPIMGTVPGQIDVEGKEWPSLIP
jgi:hypothetical protein